MITVHQAVLTKRHFSRKKTKDFQDEQNRNFDDFDSRLDFRRFRSRDETTSTGSVRPQAHPQGQMFAGQERRRLPRLHPPLPQGLNFTNNFCTVHMHKDSQRSL